MQTCRGNHASNRLRRKEAGRAAPEKDADDLTPSDVDCLRFQVALQRFHITSLVELAVQCVGIEVAIRTLAHTPWEVHVERKRGDRRPAIPPLSLYVHFPWCVRKCPYCDFNSYTLHGELDERRYVEALECDLEAQAVDVRGREVVSIFFGGGTPSLFSPEAIGRVIAAARLHLTLAEDAEVTMEANPGAIERGKFGEYRAAGLTRVSLGAQSFDPLRLQALGRIHSPDETRR